MRRKLITLMLILVLFPASCLSETLYALCRKGSHVNIRTGPSRKSVYAGMLEPCETVESTGKERYGFTQVNVSLEVETAWVFTGYLVDEQPVWSGETWRICSNAPVLCRKWIDGPVKKKLRNGALVTVYWYTEKWAVTNKGYIQTQFMEVEP